MLENILNLVKEQAGGLITENQLIPNAQNEQATQAASDSIVDVLKSKISGGDLSSVTALFQGDDSGGLGQQIQQSFTEKLGGLGIGGDAAQQASGALIPTILSGLASKLGSGEGGFNLQGLMQQFAGADGKLDISDIGNLLGGNNEEGGGILGSIKKLF